MPSSLIIAPGKQICTKSCFIHPILVLRKYKWSPLQWSLKEVIPDPFCKPSRLQRFSVILSCIDAEIIRKFRLEKASGIDEEPKLQERSALFFLNQYCISFVNYYLFHDSMFNYQPKHENISTQVFCLPHVLWLLMNYGMCSNTFGCSLNSELQ